MFTYFRKLKDIKNMKMYRFLLPVLKSVANLDNKESKFLVINPDETFINHSILPV
jgi:hypothetical protein